jgi:hypothetical protein
MPVGMGLETLSAVIEIGLLEQLNQIHVQKWSFAGGKGPDPELDLA